MAENDEKSAMNKALNYLGYSARTISQMRKYLQKKEFSDEIIETTIEKLKDYGYLDDEDFAKRLLENNVNRGMGKRIVKEKLYRSGLDSEISQQVLEELDPERERENALGWAKKILPKIKDEDPVKRKQKLFRRLISKGFTYNTVNEIMDDLEIFEKNGDDDAF